MNNRLSNRVQRVTGSLTLAIDDKAKQMKSQGIDVISFGAGEPDFDTPAHIRAAAQAAMDAGQTRYTPAAGTPALRQAVCDKLQRRNGLVYKPSQIVITNGAKQALCNTFFALLNEGDEAILLAPCWVSYPELIQMAGGVPVVVHRQKRDGFRLDLDALAAAMSERTRLIVLNTPDNPCGGILTAEELKAIYELARAHDCYIVADEIYEEFVYEGKAPDSIGTLGEDAQARTVIVNGVSKTYAMTGWRVGYSASNEALAKAMGNWQSHATGNVNSIAQAAALAALNGPQDCVREMVAQFDKRMRTMVERINAMPLLHCEMPKGAFYVMADIEQAFGKVVDGVTIADSMSFAQCLLTHAGVAVVPGSGFFEDTMVRLSYALSMEDLQRGMDKMEAFMRTL